MHTWREGKLNVLCHIGSGHNQTCRNKRKKKKIQHQTNEKASQNQAPQQNFHQIAKLMGCSPYKVLWSILTMGQCWYSDK